MTCRMSISPSLVAPGSASTGTRLTHSMHSSSDLHCRIQKPADGLLGLRKRPVDDLRLAVAGR